MGHRRLSNMGHRLFLKLKCDIGDPRSRAPGELVVRLSAVISFKPPIHYMLEHIRKVSAFGG